MDIIENWKEGDLVCVSCGLVLEHHIVDTRGKCTTFADQSYDVLEEHGPDCKGRDDYESASRYSATNSGSESSTVACGWIHELGVRESVDGIHDFDSNEEFSRGYDGVSSTEEDDESENENEESSDYQDYDEWVTDVEEDESDGGEDDENSDELAAVGYQNPPAPEREIEGFSIMENRPSRELPAAVEETSDQFFVAASFPKRLSSWGLLILIDILAGGMYKGEKRKTPRSSPSTTRFPYR